MVLLVGGVRGLAWALHCGWVAAALLGAVLSAHACLHILAADEFAAWDTVQRRFPMIESLGASAPLVDPRSWVPAHFTVSGWREPSAYKLRVYGGILAFNVMAAVALLVTRSRVRTLCHRIAGWTLQPRHRRARVTILVFLVMFVFTYHTKALPGFWYPGIAGWTYQGYVTTLQQTPKDSATLTFDDWKEGRPGFLQKAVLAENACYVERDGYVTRPTMFLHYVSGRTEPGNAELLQMVFPRYVFGARVVPQRHREAYLDILQTTLEDLTRGRRFLLPINWAYPVHNMYMPIDYEDYPPARLLRGVSFWDVTVYVEDGRAEVVGGRLLGEVLRGCR